MKNPSIKTLKSVCMFLLLCPLRTCRLVYRKGGEPGSFGPWPGYSLVALTIAVSALLTLALFELSALTDSALAVGLLALITLVLT